MYSFLNKLIFVLAFLYSIAAIIYVVGALHTLFF